MQTWPTLSLADGRAVPGDLVPDSPRTFKAVMSSLGQWVGSATGSVTRLRRCTSRRCTSRRCPSARCNVATQTQHTTHTQTQHTTQTQHSEPPKGDSGESNPGPLAPRARIMPLDHYPKNVSQEMWKSILYTHIYLRQKQRPTFIKSVAASEIVSHEHSPPRIVHATLIQWGVPEPLGHPKFTSLALRLLAVLLARTVYGARALCAPAAPLWRARRRRRPHRSGQ